MSATASNDVPMIYVLHTDWGDIVMPADMVGMTPLRKDGVPDRRYRCARLWWACFGQEAEKLKRKCLEFQGRDEKGAG